MNFMIMDSDRHHLQDILRQMVPGFFTSPEYLDLDEVVRVVDGIVVAALTRYGERMLKEQREAQVAAWLAGVEAMSSSKDPQVLNYVYTEVFDTLTSEGLEITVARLGPNSRGLYADWLKRLEDAEGGPRAVET